MKKPLPLALRIPRYIKIGERAFILDIELFPCFRTIVAVEDINGDGCRFHFEDCPQAFRNTGYKSPYLLSLDDMAGFKEVFAKHPDWKSLEDAAISGDDDALYATCWFFGAQQVILYKRSQGYEGFKYIDSDQFFEQLKLV